MTEEKKIKVKIKYAGEKQANSQHVVSEPRMVTEWHVKRIIGAAMILLLIIIGSLYAVLNLREVEPESESRVAGRQQQVRVIDSGEELVVETEQLVIAEPVIRVDEPQPEINASNIGERSSENIASEKEPSPLTTQQLAVVQGKQVSVTVPGDSTTLPKGLTRALLTKRISKKEPVGELISPIIIDNNKAIGIFYFTELKDMKGKAVYHVWKRGDKVVYKKKISIWGDRWRAATSKLISQSSLGIWSVQLLDADGHLMNEIQFTVAGS